MRIGRLLIDWHWSTVRGSRRLTDQLQHLATHTTWRMLLLLVSSSSQAPKLRISTGAAVKLNTEPRDTGQVMIATWKLTRRGQCGRRGLHPGGEVRATDVEKLIPTPQQQQDRPAANNATEIPCSIGKACSCSAWVFETPGSVRPRDASAEPGLRRNSCPQRGEDAGS